MMRWLADSRQFIAGCLLFANIAPAIAGPPPVAKSAGQARAGSNFECKQTILEKTTDLRKMAHGYFFAIDADKTGQLIAIGYYSSVRLFSTDTDPASKGKQLREEDAGLDVRYLIFSPDGKTIAVRRDEVTGAEIWGINMTDKPLQVLNRPDYKKLDDNSASGLAFTRKGDKVAVAIQNLTDPEHPRTSQTSGFVDIYSPQSGAWSKRIAPGSTGVRAVCFGMKDGAIVLACDIAAKPRNPNVTEISLWDLKTANVIRKLTVEAAIKYLASDVNGKWIAACAGGNDTTYLIDAQSGKQITTLKGRCANFSDDGKFLATGSADGKLRIWNLKNDPGFKKPEEITASAPVDFVKFVAGDSRLLAESMASSRKSAAPLQIQVWRLPTAGKR